MDERDSLPMDECDRAHYAVFLLPTLLTRRWRWPTIVATTLLVVPANWVYSASPDHPVGLAVLHSVYPLALSLLLLDSIRHMWEERKPADTP